MSDHDASADPNSPSLTGLLRRVEGGLELRERRLADLNEEVSAVKGEAKRLRQAESALEAIESARSNGNWCEVIRQIDRAKDLGAILDEFADGTSSEIERFRLSAVEQADESLSELSSSLPAAFHAMGLPPDQSYRFPIFKLRNGFFEVRINKPRFEAQIRVRHGNTLKVAADLAIIVEATTAEDVRCFGSPPTSSEFSARLRTAYAAVTGPDKASAVPLEDVRLAIAEPVPARDEFAIALASVLHEKPSEAIGMNLDHTRSTDTGFLLPGFEDRGYFGHISFTDV